MIVIRQMVFTLSRKMRSLPIFLTFVVSALATDNTNYYGQPMDYFDDNFNSNVKISPDSTFSFNFEQIRRDQPSQLEMREENVGRYIYARPQTTTPASIFSMKADRQSQHVYPSMTSSNNYQQQQGHWNNQQAPPVPPPPKFDFSKPHNEPKLQRNSAPTWNNPALHQSAQPRNFNNYAPQVPSVPTPPPHPVQWTEPPKPKTTPSPYYAPRQPKGPEGVHFAPSASYVSDSISNNSPRQPPAVASRGNHKFSWDDIKKQEPFVPNVNNQQVQPPKPGAPQSIHNKPPPPIPTLSPWYDNFGK